MEKQFGIFLGNKNDIKKLIFLDIDGVLVTLNTIKNKNFVDEEGRYIFDENAQNILEDIIKGTNAKIVITSSWKKNDLEYIKHVFHKRNFKFVDSIIGEIGTVYKYLTEEGRQILSLTRGNEIQTWLEFYFGYDFNEKIKYVIIDDDSDMLYSQRNNFVQTTFETGLTQELGKKAMQILNGFSV